ncbi:MAG: Do family serine endopeptidase [Planctomycetales bacterium]|nr:Do family serine endopeptidase [Planctomycetales bacterium]
MKALTRFNTFSAAILASVLAMGSAAFVYSESGGKTAAPGAPAGKPAVPLSAGEKQAVSHAMTLSEAFRAASERVLPAVVSIQHTTEARLVKRESVPNLKGRGGSLPKELQNDPLLRRFFGEGSDGFPGLPGMDELPDMRSIPQSSSGSGVIIDKSGIVLTNNHVVAGGGKIVVKLHDGREIEATDVKTDPNTDIAVVKIKADGDLPAAVMGDSDAMRIGDWVLALGQPFGLQDTVTAGIISAKQRSVAITKHAEFLQTDAAINPGNSGGPLVNLEGEVVGINTAINSTSGGNQGIGFAVPVNVAKWVSSQLLKDGKVHRAYLGVGIQPVTQDLAGQFGLKTPTGALVTDVFPDSPAAKAGIQPQDVIVEFAGHHIASSAQLPAIAGRTTIGSKQPVVVLRDGKRVELSMTMREQPANFGVRTEAEENGEGSRTESPTQSFDKLGLEVSPLSADLAKQLGIKEVSGVLITSVQDGGPAAKAGLEPGMVITQIGRKAVKTAGEFEAATKDVDLKKGVLLLVRTAQGSRFVVVRGE